MTTHTEIELYQCKNCGAIAGVKAGGCPTCGHNEGEEYAMTGLDGEVDVRRKSWCETIRVEGSGVIR